MIRQRYMNWLLCGTTFLGLLLSTVSRAEDAPKQSRTDSLGDPLPEAALLRLGTQRFHHPSSVVDLGLSPDEKTVVTIGSRQLIAWERSTGKELWRTRPGRLGVELPSASYGIRGVAFSSDSTQFYTPGRLNQLIIWDVASGTSETLSFEGKLPYFEAAGEADQFVNSKSIDVTQDGEKFAVGCAGGVTVCDLKGGVLFEVKNQPKGPLTFGRDRLTFGGHYSYGRFSPDEKLLAVVSSDSPEEVQLYDAVTGKAVRRIKLTSRLVRLAFSPDSKQIVATERDIAARLYEVASGKEVWSYKIEPNTNAESYMCGVAYSPDAKLIAACTPVGSNYDIRLLDAKSGKEVGKLSGHVWKPWTLAFTSDSKVLISSGWDGAVRQWDVGSRKQLALPRGVRASAAVTASPDGRTLAYVDHSGTIRLVDPKSAKELRTIGLPDTTYSQLEFSPNGLWLAGGGTFKDKVHVAIWDLKNDQVVYRWDWPKGNDPHSKVEALSFRPNGKQLAAAVFRQSSAYLWDLTSGQQIAHFKHPSVYGLSFSPDGETLATAGWDSIVRFWDTGAGEKRREFNVADGLKDKGDHRMYTVCFAPTGGVLATAHLDGKVRIWNATDLTLVKEFEVKGRFIYGSICFSPDGALLATGSMGGKVELWDPLTGELVWDAGKHENRVYTVAFGADNRTLVSGGRDGVCYLWDLRPRGEHPERELEALWKDLSGDGAAAYRAMWAMAEKPDRSTALIRKKLGPVATVMDLDHITVGLSVEDAVRRKRLAKLLAARNEKTELAIVVKRAISLLRQFGTADAAEVLKELATINPNGDVGRLATRALEQMPEEQQADETR